MSDDKSERPEYRAASDAPEDTTAVDWDRPETWPEEVGGPKGPEPTRFGDWERNGRCSDF